MLLLASLVALGVAQETGARYVIITPDTFYQAVEPLAQWKCRKGVRTKIVRLSEIGSDSAQIRDFLLDAYNNWQIRPEYVLFVGADNFLCFPSYGGYSSDNYYANITGDLFNEILPGRFTVHSLDEARNVVNKILLYERYPDTTDAQWCLRSCLIANTDGDPPDDSIYFENARYYATLMTANGYVQIDTLSDIWGDDKNDVMAAVNNGCSFVLFRGSGVNNWPYPFDCNPDAAGNRSEFPFVLSITCRTLGTGSSAAMAERWFLTGSVSLPRGAVGYFATTTVLTGGAHLRSAVAKGFAAGVFLDSLRTFGAACENGRRNVYNMYSSVSEYRGFTTIGDPELNIWLDTPRLPVVDHPPVAYLGFNEFTVTVTRDGIPVEDALVCVMQADTMIYETGYTAADGTVSLSFNVGLLDTLFVTVTSPVTYPYEGWMIVVPEGAYVSHLRHTVSDSLGNENGRINPGEQFTIDLWVRNYGVDTALGVGAVVRSNNSLAWFADSLCWIGDLLPGDSTLVPEAFTAGVGAGAPDMHRLDLELVCYSPADTWPSWFDAVVYAPRCVLAGDSIMGGNGDGLLEPGETADLVAYIANEGHENATGVTGVLHSLDVRLTILDSLGSFGGVLVGDTADNLADRFVVRADTGIVQGTAVDCELVIANGYTDDTLSVSLVIGRRQYLVWNPAQTPGPGQNMHTILGSLGYQGDYSTTLPESLCAYQSVLACAGVFPNNHVIYDGSAEANALVSFLNGGGRVYLEGGDVWYYDPLSAGGHDFGPMFGITPTSDGMSSTGPIQGMSPTFTSGMYFNYAGENSWMDEITANGAAFNILQDADDFFYCGVAHDAGVYRTVGTAFELGALTDGAGVSTRAALLDSIMHFFGISVGIEEELLAQSRAMGWQVRFYPVPANNAVRVGLSIPVAGPVTIRVFDAAGRCVRCREHATTPGIPCEWTWDGRDGAGRLMAAGIYFIRVDCDAESRTGKVILTR